MITGYQILGVVWVWILSIYLLRIQDTGFLTSVSSCIYISPSAVSAVHVNLSIFCGFAHPQLFFYWSNHFHTLLHLNLVFTNPFAFSKSCVVSILCIYMGKRDFKCGIFFCLCMWNASDVYNFQRMYGGINPHLYITNNVIRKCVQCIGLLRHSMKHVTGCYKICRPKLQDFDLDF